MRAYEDQITAGTMVCAQEDFETAFYLVDKSLESSLDIFNLLPAVKSPTLHNKKQKLFNLLPGQFQRRLAIEIGVKEKISERSTDRWLQKLIRDKKLSQPSMGEYVKI